MKTSPLDSSPAPAPCLEFARRAAALRQRALEAPDDTRRQFLDLEDQFLVLESEARARLLGTPLAWSEEERRQASRLRRMSNELSLLGYALHQALGQRHGWGDDRTHDTAARTLRHMGDTVKWESSVARDARHDFAKPHGLLRAARGSGRLRERFLMAFDGIEAECTIESLYFRVLVLARLCSGALNARQIEILDAWIRLSMSVLEGVEAAPSGSALRVDLDSRDGLKRGRRSTPGPTLYLSPRPIADAHAAVVRELRQGRMVPAEGLASRFRIEEHIAVLDLIRRGLRDSMHGEVPRAERHRTNLVVELHVGVAEILKHGFSPPSPPAAALTLAASGGQRVGSPRVERERDTAIDSIYDRPARMARVADTSDTGFGIEGGERDCGDIAAGDLIGFRLDSHGPFQLGRVVRAVPSDAAGRVWIGVQRIAAPVLLLEAIECQGPRRVETLLFLPGEDASGRHDACLVSDRTFARHARYETAVGGCVYTLYFDCARERGRGWVLAGTEIVAARPEAASA
jgi:hypothetical protein